MNENIRVFIDFGSTYTKAVAIDIAKAELIGSVRVPSTVETDITIGLSEALDRLATGKVPGGNITACSSAAGGLKMVCIGFVPELTSEAAYRAALGAGARVTGLYSYELNRSEIAEIEASAPDIVLLTGGTDGGDRKTIVHNAQLLAQTGPGVKNVIVAGNKSAADEIKDIFRGSEKNIVFTSNVMPDIGVLDMEGGNREIRRLFMNRIVEAKGIGRARRLIGDIIMPTPSAVLEAARWLAEGAGGEAGFGELIVIDVGGATTDVHSIARGVPSRDDIVTMGLPEPYEKRTVEGDLGLKYNIPALMELVKGRQLPVGLAEAVAAFQAGKLPATDEEYTCHEFLTRCTVEIAVNRHAGRLEEVYRVSGRMLVQRGKDLTRVGTVIGTGGPVIFARNPGVILSGALYDERQPAVLKPKAPKFLLDRNYILFAIGLLGQKEPETAVRIARRYLSSL